MKGCYWTLAAALAGGIVAFGADRERHRADAPGGPDAGAEFRLSPEEAAPLPDVRAVAERMAAKENAVRALLSGEATLPGAAARFRELDAQEPPVPVDKHPEVYAGATEAERYCRAVICWAGNYAWNHAPGDPAVEAGRVTRRLEEELEAHRRHGTLALPPAPDDGR